MKLEKFFQTRVGDGGGDDGDIGRHEATINRSEGFALTGYDIPGCVEDGAWMLWENSSAAVAAAVAHPGLEKLFEFHYRIGPSGVRGSIRLVFRSTDARIL